MAKRTVILWPTMAEFDRFADRSRDILLGYLRPLMRVERGTEMGITQAEIERFKPLAEKLAIVDIWPDHIDFCLDRDIEPKARIEFLIRRQAARLTFVFPKVADAALFKLCFG